MLTASVLYIYLGPLLTKPNQHASVFGGDGLTIHYNLQYHATWGEGTHLKSQFHPEGENIFLTDAQGLLAITLSRLKNIIPGIQGKAVGISNALIHWSNCIAAVFLFLILLRLKVNQNLAIPLAILIALLAPQIHRQTCGHYALGYAFLIPMVILYLLSNIHGLRRWLTLLGIGTVLLIFGLNNPYTLAVNSSFLLGCFGIGLLLKISKLIQLTWSELLSWLVLVILSLGTAYAIISSHDFVDDRTVVPAGFFYNQASLRGLLAASESWFGDLWGSLFKLKVNSFESRAYLGVATIFTCLLLLIKKTAFITQLKEIPKLKVLLLSSLLVLIFAFSFPFNLIKSFATDHLGIVLQFRAPGRFSWVFYYMMTLLAGIGINLIWEGKLFKLTWLNKILPILLILLWTFETHDYLNWRTKGKVHHNTFAPDRLKVKKDLCTKLELNSTNYQGIYLIPTEQGWTDKILHEGKWRSNYEGYQISLASGVPLINGKMSRMSLSTTLNSLQLVSDPLIERELLNKLDDRKIIFLVDKEKPRDLYVKMDTLFEDENIVLKTIHPDSLQNRLIQYNNALDTITPAKAIYYNHFKQETKQHFATSKAKNIGQGKQEIDKIIINPQTGDQLYHLSFWYLPDNNIPGGPFYTVKLFNQSDELTHKETKWVLEAYDTQKGWIKINFEIPVDSLSKTIILDSDYKFYSTVDELLLRRKEDKVEYRDNAQQIINNIKVSH